MVRGSAVLPIAAWLVQQVGDSAVLQAVYDTLDHSERCGLHVGQPNFGVDARSWYLPGLVDALLVEAERRVMPESRDRYLRALGAHIMREGVNIFYRSIFKLFVSTRAAVENVGTAWERYYSDGRVEAAMTGQAACRATFANWRGHTRRICEATAYSGLHLLEITGARDTRIQNLGCRGDGEGDCHWEFAWSE